MTPELSQPFLASCRFGLEHLDDIVRAESVSRGFPPAFVRQYLTHNLRLELDETDYKGLDLFLRYAAELDAEQAAC